MRLLTMAAESTSWVVGEDGGMLDAVRETGRETERESTQELEDAVENELTCPRPMNMHPSSADSENDRPEEMVVGHSVSFPGCLSSITTLTIPIEQRVLRFREEFTHSVVDIRSRLSVLLGRSVEVEERTQDLTQRTDEVEKEVKQVQRHQSDLSERLESSLTECGRRQDEMEQQAAQLEVRTTILESVDTQAVTDYMKSLAEQMQEVKERLALAEIDAAKAKIASDDMQAKKLMERLESLENKFQSRFPVCSGQPLRSFSHP